MRLRSSIVVFLNCAAVCLFVATPTISGQATYPRTFTDGRKHTVTLKAKPMRIASVVLGMDENLVDLVEPSRLVAMTELAKDPYVSNVSDRVPMGIALVRDKAQVVTTAKPDLVLAATYTPTLADPLLAQKLPVYQFTEFNSLEALLKNLETLGQLVGEPAKASAVLARDRALLAEAAKKPWPQKLRAIYFSEGAIFTKGTVPSDVLTAAGLVDVAAQSGKTGYVKANAALIAMLQPDVILFGEDTKAAEAETLKMFQGAEYKAVPAVKAGRVYALPGKHITTTSHNIVKAVQDVQRLVK